MKRIMMLAGTALISMQVQAVDLKPEAIVEAANQQWNQAFNQGKIEQLVALYAEDATLSPGNGAVLRGHDAIKALFSGFQQNGVHNHQIKAVDVISSDKQITQVGYWQAKGQNAKQEAISFGGVLVTVLQQNEAGEWQLQSHVWNMAP
ncbi:YybH family protein [Methylophaga sp. OBS4]|uniref:YybH family protein n=1 Tax=Methylophaga sp. OBS4 TaxID=2991935 RepID=UPI0022539F57|nr:DUF4440 domain-containing protein [Methylophaga sp. OBS4]MCX4188110.1 DUF4440 domain-containing protein [Methylophaga sp. OBS4]